jgi:hypothetical protein
MPCSIKAESLFGPQVAPECRDGFDFTLLFEELILTLIPLSLVSLILPLRLWQLLNQNLKVKVGSIYFLKLVCNLSDFVETDITSLTYTDRQCGLLFPSIGSLGAALHSRGERSQNLGVYTNSCFYVSGITCVCISIAFGAYPECQTIDNYYALPRSHSPF